MPQRAIARELGRGLKRARWKFLPGTAVDFPRRERAADQRRSTRMGCFLHADETVIAETRFGFVLDLFVDFVRIVEHRGIEQARSDRAVSDADPALLVK